MERKRDLNPFENYHDVYQRMIEEIRDYAIILLNENGIIQNWNAGAETIKGYKGEEVIGKKFEIFYTPEDRAINLPDTLLNQAKTTGKASHEGWRVRKDGTRFWGTIVITALHNKEGDVIGFTKVTRDLTEKKLAEDKLAQYTAELERQNTELEQFAYVASHDLQEPLRKIQTFTSLIRDNYHNQAFVERYFEKLDSSAKRMSELVRSLLNYSRLSMDMAGVTQVDLNKTLDDIKQDFELLIEEKKAVINSEELPVIEGNPVQFGQLFANLISNSLKFSSENPVITITHSRVSLHEIPNPPKTLQDVPYHRISFRDNGIGFEDKYNKLIFSLFQRLQGRNEYEGTGIGLTLCKKIVENHAGFIDASGELHKGAVFNVYLPDKIS